MLQLCGVLPCSVHRKKDLIELKKIQKMVGICFHMMSDGVSWDSLNLEKRWREVYKTMSVTEKVNTDQFVLSSKRWSKSCLNYVPAGRL